MKSLESSSYCISLPDSLERRDLFAARAKRYGIDFAWWPAVDGRGARRETLEQMAAPIRIQWDSHGGRPPLKPTEVGCALSHHALWKQAIVDDLDQIVIFEDDAVLCRPLDFDVDPGVDLVFMSDLVPTNEIGEPWGGGTPCTHAYIATRSGVRKLIEIFDTILYPVDLQMMSHIDSLIRLDRPLTRGRDTGKPILKVRMKRGYAWQDGSFPSTITPDKPRRSRWFSRLRRLLTG